MSKPANDTQDYTPDPYAIGGAAKVLGILLNVVQALQIAAFIGLLAMAILTSRGNIDREALREQALTPGSHLAILLYGIGSLAVMIGIVWQLRKLVRTLRHGDPFVPVNAVRLRYIWIILAIGEAFRTGVRPFIDRLDPAVDFSLDLRPNVWFFVLILIVLAQVFKEGARLREETRLTV